jgi:hypothetical protein
MTWVIEAAVKEQQPKICIHSIGDGSFSWASKVAHDSFELKRNAAGRHSFDGTVQYLDRRKKQANPIQSILSKQGRRGLP